MQVITKKEIRIEKNELISTCKSWKNKGFTFLTMLSAICRENGLDMVYILDNWETKEQLTIYVLLTENPPVIDSLIHLWKGADWLEREVFDMFGIHFYGHHNLTRILLEDNAEYFPLLKSFKETN